MRSSKDLVKRPFAVTLIAIFQLALAAYCLYYSAIALLNPPGNLGLLRSAVLSLMGRTDTVSNAGHPQQDITLDLIFFVALALTLATYSAITGFGLWHLKKWARHSVAGEYGIMAVLLGRAFFVFGVQGGFGQVPTSKLQPVETLFVLAAMISMTLLFYGGVAEAFCEAD